MTTWRPKPPGQNLIIDKRKKGLCLASFVVALKKKQELTDLFPDCVPGECMGIYHRMWSMWWTEGMAHAEWNVQSRRCKLLKAILTSYNKKVQICKQFI